MGVKHTFEYNGAPKLRLEPTSEVESMILREMAEASAKGVTTTLKQEGNQFVLTVGNGTKEP